MRTFCYSFLLLCLSAGAVFAQSDEGFTSLFNGENLDGWVVEHGTPADVIINNGTMFISGRNHYPFWIRSEKQYENFDLRFEFRMDGWCNSGVFYHAPLHGRNSKVGFEYQIDHKNPRNEPPSIKTCGAIFGAVPPRINNIRGNKEWNEGRIVVNWPHIQHYVNGELVVDVNAESNQELRYRKRKGFIGLQGLGYNVWFRNIEIKELPTENNWVSLFNGNNFDGWYQEGSGAKWSVRNGAMRAEDGTSYMVTNDTFKNYYFQTYIRTSKNANGGIFLAWNQLQGGDRGNEVQIENVPDSNYPTGSLYNIIRCEQPPYEDDEWFPMQIFLNNAHLVIRVNGETTVETMSFPSNREGHISLQMHSHNDYIEFKDLEILEY